MDLQKIDRAFAVCKLAPGAPIDCGGAFVFAARTDHELSLVCEAAHVPPDALAVEPGFTALRVAGTLDFGLVGILASLTATLARAGIAVFAVSTYETDYLLVKADALPGAVRALEADGHTVR